MSNRTLAIALCALATGFLLQAQEEQAGMKAIRGLTTPEKCLHVLPLLACLMIQKLFLLRQ